MPANFYRRIPRTVRALQFILTDTFEAELREFAGDAVHLEGCQIDVKVNTYGRRFAMPGDWIVQVHPETVFTFTVLTPEEFAHDYEHFPALDELEKQVHGLLSWQLQQSHENAALHDSAQRMLTLIGGIRRG